MAEMVQFLMIDDWQHHLHPSTGREQSGKRPTPLGDEICRLTSFQFVYRNGPDCEILENLSSGLWGATNQQQRWYAFFGNIVLELRRSNATDAKDKIYSILGLVTPFLPPGIESTIVPTYSGTVPDLYTHVTTLLLQNVPLLSILSFVEDKSCRNVDCLPSWVPDYTFRFSAQPFICLGERVASNGKRTPGGIYNASQGLNIAAPPPQVSGSILSLSGACFDTVVGACVSFGQSDEPLSIQPILDICLSLDAVYTPTNQVREEVLWRTWIADSYQTSSPAPENLATSFHDYIRHSVANSMLSIFDESDDSFQLHPTALVSLRESSGRVDILPSLEEIIETTQDIINMVLLRMRPDIETEKEVQQLHLKIVGKMAAFNQARSITTLNRGLFRTSKGFLGLGPCSLQAGDEVWMLRNSLVPFILRKEERGENYTLIGEAYLHGFMQGEMLTPELVERVGVMNIT